MKKIVPILLCSIIFIFSLSSCENNTVDYPEKFTTDYCNENYIEADPNLIYLISADNYIGTIDVPGGRARYYAIKDVSIDDYLLLDESIMMAMLSYQIVKNKYNMDLPQQEILSYEIKSVLIYSLSDTLDELDKRALGEKMVGEIVASINGNDAIDFQNHIIDCIETQNYKKAGIEGDLYEVVDKIHVRVVFEKYENLAWESGIFRQNDTYYINCHVPANSTDVVWHQVWLPINQEFAKLISQFLA